MVLIVSIGGLIFGFDTGQISGFLSMPDFLNRFGDLPPKNGGAVSFANPMQFSNVRSGTIVGLLSIGTLFGAIGGGEAARVSV